jgi:hypothetical protein
MLNPFFHLKQQFYQSKITILAKTTWPDLGDRKMKKFKFVKLLTFFSL